MGHVLPIASLQGLHGLAISRPQGLGSRQVTLSQAPSGARLWLLLPPA